MIVILPIAMLLLLVAFLLRTRRARLSVLLALLSAQVVVAMGTELLSLFQGIDRWTVLGMWCLVAVGAAVYIAGRRDELVPLVRRLGETIRGIRGRDRVLIGMILFSLWVVFIVAIVAPPNTHDSMTYHLPRVMQWITGGSMRHFPVHDFRLVEFPPGAEMAIMHTMLLARSDRFVNLVQWLSLAGSCVAVSLIARELGAGRRGQVVSALLVVAMPMAILQGSSTQNDLVAGFFTLGFVLFLLRLRNATGMRLYAECLVAGLFLGLSWHAKGTAYVYTLPFCIWLGCWMWRGEFGRRFVALAMLAVVAVALNGFHFQRNWSAFRNPLRSPVDLSVTNARLGVGVTFSNMVRNAAVHIGLPNAGYNEMAGAAIRGLHWRLGIDPDDQATTYPGEPFRVERLSLDEDYVGNFLHLLLVLGLPLAFLRRTGKTPGGLHGVYALAILGGCLFFCVMLRWQPWNSRLHLGFFLLFCPLMAIVYTGLLGERRVLIAGCVLWLASMPWLFGNATRPVIARKNIFNTPRFEWMMVKFGTHGSAYQDGCDFLRSRRYPQLGLIVGGNHYEYPVWAELWPEAPEMRYYAVRNWTGSWRLVDYEPEALLVLANPEREPVLDALEGDWTIVYTSYDFHVMERLAPRP